MNNRLLFLSLYPVKLHVGGDEPVTEVQAIIKALRERSTETSLAIDFQDFQGFPPAAGKPWLDKEPYSYVLHHIAESTRVQEISFWRIEDPLVSAEVRRFLSAAAHNTGLRCLQINYCVLYLEWLAEFCARRPSIVEEVILRDTVIGASIDSVLTPREDDESGPPSGVAMNKLILDNVSLMETLSTEWMVPRFFSRLTCPELELGAIHYTGGSPVDWSHTLPDIVNPRVTKLKLLAFPAQDARYDATADVLAVSAVENLHAVINPDRACRDVEWIAKTICRMGALETLELSLPVDQHATVWQNATDELLVAIMHHCPALVNLKLSRNLTGSGNLFGTQEVAYMVGHGWSHTEKPAGDLFQKTKGGGNI